MMTRSRTMRTLAAAMFAVGVGACASPRHTTAPQPIRLPASDVAPAWSPDGTRLAWAHTPGDVESADRGGIYVMRFANRLPIHVLEGRYSYPDWAPDSRHLVVSGGPDGGIWVMTSNGDSLTRISAARGYDPKWSPDGTTIAYQTYDEDQVYRLWVTGRDGSGTRCLNAAGGESWLEAEWSPDGARLVHVRLGGGLDVSSLFVMAKDTGEPARLTNDGHDARYPTWSADAQWIAWGSVRAGGKTELWIMRADGSDAHKLADGYWADWSPDGKRLAYTFAQDWDQAYRVFTIDRETGAIEQITH
jgi:Tol biopolymer transport system component